jgi:Family of unknown function (DUF6526)
MPEGSPVIHDQFEAQLVHIEVQAAILVADHDDYIVHAPIQLPPVGAQDAPVGPRREASLAMRLIIKGSGISSSASAPRSDSIQAQPLRPLCYTGRSFREELALAEKKPQNYSNHTRLDPPFHFFLIPIFILGLLMSLIHFFAHITEGDFRDHFHAFLLIVLAIALLLAVLEERLYALKVQDRVIRLEERLRLGELLSEPLRSRIPELTEDQLVGLRFASDAEIPQLVERTLKENLSRKNIKKAIQNWRPDYWRV